MNTKLLRQKILDLAIRGKLTDQRKSDGTARELLEQISASCHPEQSSKSAKSKNLTPITPLDKSEAPFEIPDNWEWVHLQDVGELSRGKSKHRPRNDPALYVDGFMPFVQTGDVAGAEKGLICKWHSLYNELGVAQSRIWPRGTICITIAANIGDVALLNFDACFPDSVVGFNAYKPIYSNKFFLFYLMLCKEKLDEKSRSTAQKNINIDILSQIYVPLPPLAEQQRIVEKIEEAFAEIDAVEKNKELLKKHIKQTRKKILDLAIHGKLVPQDENDEPASVLLERITRDNPHYEKLTDIPFEIPDSWEWVKLGNIGKWQSGTTPSKSNSSYYKDGTIPWLNTGDLNDGIIREIPKKVTEKALAETSLRLNEAGSVCIAMYGATIGKIGILSMPATTNQACCVCNNLKNFVNQMWLFYFLKNHKQEFIEAGFGGAQPNISKEKITATPFPLPPLAEQKRIVNKIDEIFASLDEISLHLV